MKINNVEIDHSSKLGEIFSGLSGTDWACIESAHESVIYNNSRSGVAREDCTDISVQEVLDELKKNCICQTDDLIKLLESKLKV